MEIKRILWPTDYSDNAAKAIPWLISLAEKYNAEILVLHVINAPTRFDVMSEMLSSQQYERYFEEAKKHSEEKLLETCGELLSSCKLFEKHVVIGDEAEEILKAIKDKKIDLVVMASHGRSGLTRFAFGSVADKVASHSPVPVFIAK